MSDTEKREWKFYIEDMIRFSENVMRYTNGLDQVAFVKNGLTYDATLRNLELIGESATHIPEDVRNAHPDVPWRMVVATRNQLIHGYPGIDNDTLWSIIQDNVPELLSLLNLILKETPSKN